MQPSWEAQRDVSAALSLKLLGSRNSLFDVKRSFHDLRPNFFFSSDKYLASDGEIRAGKHSLSPSRVHAIPIRFLTKAGK